MNNRFTDICHEIYHYKKQQQNIYRNKNIYNITEDRIEINSSICVHTDISIRILKIFTYSIDHE